MTYSVLTVSTTEKKRAFKWWRQRNRSYSHFAALHQLNEVSEKDVSVPLAETLSVIGHLQQGRAQRKEKERKKRKKGVVTKVHEVERFGPDDEI